MAKPRVITSCVANSYTGPNERIIEFADGDTENEHGAPTPSNGLISFTRITGDGPRHGRLQIGLYSIDGPVDIALPPNVNVYQRGKLIRKAKA